jgi:hypothetical protein
VSVSKKPGWLHLRGIVLRSFAVIVALVLAFLAAAVYSEQALLGRVSDADPGALNAYRLSLRLNLLLGALILLMTAVAQSA